MAVKGQQAKEALTQELLGYFGERAFKYDKELRVECMENGERVQIKIALTAAKVAVEKDGDVAIPGVAAIPAQGSDNPGFIAPVQAPAEPTLEEKETVKSLLSKLGL
jgi:hypothetical protein